MAKLIGFSGHARKVDGRLSYRGPVVRTQRAMGALQIDERWQAAALLLAGVLLGGVTFKLVQGKNR